MEKLVSVIVPVYNAEKYLNRCIDSIINQTYKNLEIILVDDGSKDSSPKICDEFSKSDSRVKVIHKKNGGISSVRNAGLEVFTGEYVTFIDSDDYYCEKAIELLVMAMESNDNIISCMKSNIVRHGKIVEVQSKNTEEIINSDSTEYAKLMFQKKVSESVCDKLFLGSLIKNYRFTLGKKNEDFLFISNILMLDGKISIVDYAGYNYYKHSKSITTTCNAVIFSVYNAVEVKNLIKEKKPELISYIGAYTAFQARAVLISIDKKRFKNDKGLVSFCVNTLKENREYIKNSFMSLKNQWVCFAFIHNPKFTKRILGLVLR